MDTKPGVKTSEFYVTLATMIAGVLVAVFKVDLDVEQFGAIFGPPMAYVASRGLAKIKG